jgi:hypothetical protein
MLELPAGPRWPRAAPDAAPGSLGSLATGGAGGGGAEALATGATTSTGALAAGGATSSAGVTSSAFEAALGALAGALLRVGKAGSGGGPASWPQAASVRLASNGNRAVRGGRRMTSKGRSVPLDPPREWPRNGFGARAAGRSPDAVIRGRAAYTARS